MKYTKRKRKKCIRRKCEEVRFGRTFKEGEESVVWKQINFDDVRDCPRDFLNTHLFLKMAFKLTQIIKKKVLTRYSETAQGCEP